MFSGILSAMKQQEYLNIAIVPNIAGASGRDHLSGVLKYINTGKRWSPRILNTPDDLMRDPLAKIAKDCSFRSSAALARFFLREVGVTMTSWRSKS